MDHMAAVKFLLEQYRIAGIRSSVARKDTERRAACRLITVKIVGHMT